MNDVNKACSDYLKNQEGARRIMLGFKKKYQSLGTIGGVFVLNGPNPAERDFLRGLFRMDYSDVNTIRISLKKFEKAFQNSLYAGMELDLVLESYFQEQLVSNKTRREKELDQRRRFFEEVASVSEHDMLKSWLGDILEGSTSIGAKWLYDNYKVGAQELKKNFIWLEKLINLTEQEESGILIQVAAARTTKNPHALDTDTPLQKLLLYYLSYHHGMLVPSTQLDTQLLLEMGNLLVDSGSRTVMTYGFEAYDSDDKPLGWGEFYHRGEPLLLTHMNLANVEKIVPLIPGGGSTSNKANNIYCFENPAVFNTFLRRRPELSLLCVSGQINTAVYRFLDLLVAENCSVFYHGDYDPEGLLIADKLLMRYEYVHLFGYSEGYFIKSMSKENITDKRIVQLNRLNNKILKSIGQLIKSSSRVGYEEFIIEDLIDSIK